MSWIKRNLYFLVGSVLAVGLLAVAVVYALGSSSKDSAVKEKLSASYDTLKKLKDLDPSPGTPKVDNITNAQAQASALQKYIQAAQATFLPIPPIPNTPRVDAQVFSTELAATLNALRAQAKAADNVTLPTTNPPYNFTFESIVRQVTFRDSKQLPLLARQLGEVKAIAEILFDAKIEALEGFKRLPVAFEDSPATNPNDYLNEPAKTNDWAVLVPYEVTLRCFSAQLAAVLNGFANSKHCLLVKAVNVEPAPQVDTSGYAMMNPGFNPMVPQPMFTMPYNPNPAKGGGNDALAARMRSRYGLGGGGGRGEGRFNPPPTTPPPMAMYQPPPGGGPPPPTIPQEVLGERAVRVTLKLTLVQLLGTDADNRRRGRAAN